MKKHFDVTVRVMVNVDKETGIENCLDIIHRELPYLEVRGASVEHGAFEIIADGKIMKIKPVVDHSFVVGHETAQNEMGEAITGLVRAAEWAASSDVNCHNELTTAIAKVKPWLGE